MISFLSRIFGKKTKLVVPVKSAQPAVQAMPIPAWVDFRPVPYDGESQHWIEGLTSTQEVPAGEVVQKVQEWAATLEKPEAPPWIIPYLEAGNGLYGTYGGLGRREDVFVKEGVTLENIKAWAASLSKPKRPVIGCPCCGQFDYGAICAHCGADKEA